MRHEHYERLESALTDSAEALIAARGGETSADEWEQALQRLIRAAVASVPGATSAGMTMRDRDAGLVTLAPSHPELVELDRAQARLGEGPCIDALAAGAEQVVVRDFASDERWPGFAAAAVRAGVGSMLSYPLAPQNDAPGAVNFYATGPHVFDDAVAQAVAGVFAMQAAVAVYGADRIAGLKRGLESRDLIGQAKGILIERFSLDDQQAFRLLVRSSQETNIKLIEVAAWLVGNATEQAHRAPSTGPLEVVPFAPDRVRPRRARAHDDPPNH